VAETEEVPEGATDKEAIGVTEDRSRNLRLAVRCRGRLKTRTRCDSRLRQECVTTVGRPTRRFVPALRKGHVRKGPGKKCHSGLRGQTKASRNGKRGRIVGRDQQPAVGYRSLLKQNTKDIIVRDTPEGRVCEKRRQTRLGCTNGIKDRGARQHLLLKEGIFNKAIRKSLNREIAKRMDESSIRLRGPSIWILWKCRPPPKRKR
jgi:hypothetical protein